MGEQVPLRWMPFEEGVKEGCIGKTSTSLHFPVNMCISTLFCFFSGS